jgi:hypothetical protein
MAHQQHHHSNRLPRQSRQHRQGGTRIQGRDGHCRASRALCRRISSLRAERVIYVTDLWYQMSVTFKKDFLAKVGMLLKTISGRHAFEVHDDHSNEKVGEVTPFGGSLEVYK